MQGCDIIHIIPELNFFSAAKTYKLTDISRDMIHFIGNLITLKNILIITKS